MIEREEAKAQPCLDLNAWPVFKKTHLSYLLIIIKKGFYGFYDFHGDDVASLCDIFQLHCSYKILQYSLLLQGWQSSLHTSMACKDQFPLVAAGPSWSQLWVVASCCHMDSTTGTRSFPLVLWLFSLSKSGQIGIQAQFSL